MDSFTFLKLDCKIKECSTYIQWMRRNRLHFSEVAQCTLQDLNLFSSSFIFLQRAAQTSSWVSLKSFVSIYSIVRTLKMCICWNCFGWCPWCGTSAATASLCPLHPSWRCCFAFTTLKMSRMLLQWGSGRLKHSVKAFSMSNKNVYSTADGYKTPTLSSFRWTNSARLRT